MDPIHLGDRRDHVRAFGFSLGHSIFWLLIVDLILEQESIFLLIHPPQNTAKPGTRARIQSPEDFYGRK
jgi:hypothetical protein